MPYLAFGVFLLINKLANHDITPFYIYAFIIVALIVGDFLKQRQPCNPVIYFFIVCYCSLADWYFFYGLTSVYAFISVGLFCSTLWPCIYTLAIAGLGKHTGEGSNFLIMMIMGGGVISLLQGYLARPEYYGHSMVVPGRRWLLCLPGFLCAQSQIYSAGTGH